MYVFTVFLMLALNNNIIITHNNYYILAGCKPPRCKSKHTYPDRPCPDDEWTGSLESLGVFAITSNINYYDFGAMKIL